MTTKAGLIDDVERLAAACEREKKARDADARRLAAIRAIIEQVDARCAAADGPVPPTLKEMTQDEISTIYALSRRKPASWRPH